MINVKLIELNNPTTSNVISLMDSIIQILLIKIVKLLMLLLENVILVIQQYIFIMLHSFDVLLNLLQFQNV